jgi:hypothetical protein
VAYPFANMAMFGPVGRLGKVGKVEEGEQCQETLPIPTFGKAHRQGNYSIFSNKAAH